MWARSRSKNATQVQFHHRFTAEAPCAARTAIFERRYIGAKSPAAVPVLRAWQLPKGPQPGDCPGRVGGSQVSAALGVRGIDRHELDRQGQIARIISPDPDGNGPQEADVTTLTCDAEGDSPVSTCPTARPGLFSAS